MIARLHGGRHEVPGNGGGRHASHHQGCDAQQAAHLGIDKGLAGGILDQTRPKLLDPVNGVIDGMLIAVEQLGLVPHFDVRAIHGASQDDPHARSILVAVGEDPQTGDTAGTKVHDVSGTGEDGGPLPIHGIMGDHADQGGDHVLVGGSGLPEILAGPGPKDWNGEGLGGDLNVFEVFHDAFIGRGQVLAVEGGGDGQEAVDEANLALGVRDPVLVEARGGLDLAQTQVQTIQREGRASDDKVPGAVDQGDGDVTIFGEVLVGGIDVAPDSTLGEIPDGQHGGGCPFTVLDRILQHGGSDGGPGVGLLAAEADPEEGCQGIPDGFVEGVPGRGRGNGGGGDDTLRMTGGTVESFQHLAGLAAQDLAGNHEVGELHQTDEGKAHGGGDQVVGVGLRIAILEPTDDIQALGIQLTGLGVVGERLQQVGGGMNQILDERGVGGIDLAQFIKVLLDVALTTKDRVDTGLFLGGSPEEGRVVGLGSTAGSRSPGVVRPHDQNAFGRDAGQGGGHGMDIISTHKGTLKLIEGQLQDFQVRPLGIILTFLDLMGDVGNITSDQLSDGGGLLILSQLIGRLR